MEKFCDVILVTFFDNVIMVTLLNFYEVRFCHNQFEKTQFCQTTQLQVTNIEGMSAWRFLIICY